MLKLVPVPPPTLYIQKAKELKENIEKYTTELICNKENTFSQDKMAYEVGHTYRWTGRTNSHTRSMFHREVINLKGILEAASSVVSTQTVFQLKFSSSRKTKGGA